MVSSVFRKKIDQSGILQDACLAYSSEKEQNLSARPQVSCASGAFTYLLIMIAEGTSAFKGLAAGVFYLCAICTQVLYRQGRREQVWQKGFAGEIFFPIWSNSMWLVQILSDFDKAYCMIVCVALSFCVALFFEMYSCNWAVYLFVWLPTWQSFWFAGFGV